jgi:hypothetical protein
MAQNLPKAEPAFRVFSRGDDSFGVEITIPPTEPTSVTPFATEGAALAWIADYQKRLEKAQDAPRGRPRSRFTARR